MDGDESGISTETSAKVAKLTVVVCTHNRVQLLARTLESLNRSARPQNCDVELLIVANACTDSTVEFLRSYVGRRDQERWIPLRWVSEPIAGKSHALNTALPLVHDGILVFVDDDHRVDVNYLVQVAKASQAHPHAGLICGRVLADWDGREPSWVHDTGPYRIYPLPIPNYQQSDQTKEITREGPAPGGGNLCVRREVFDRIGEFSTQLGPHGHDLGGGEDSDFVHRCLAAGERIQYVPEILQYHYVDLERLRLSYLLRKSFQRSRSGVRINFPHTSSIPRYMWRKVASYLFRAGLSASWARTRFFLVRVAAALGEIRGFMDNAAKPQSSQPYDPGDLPADRHAKPSHRPEQDIAE